MDLGQLDRSLAYQLAERVDFVRAPDPIVANLALDWATLNLAGGPIESARSLYGLAIHYGTERDARMLARLRHIARVLSQRSSKAAQPLEAYDCPLCQPPPPPPPPPDQKSGS